MNDLPATCPKCGFDAADDEVGSPFSGPSYVGPQDVTDPTGREWSIPEHLRWRCKVCGYIIETDTLDQADV